MLGAGLVLVLLLELVLEDPLAEALPLADPLRLPELLGPGENVGVDGEDPEHPAREAAPRTASVRAGRGHPYANAAGCADGQWPIHH